VSPSQSVTSIKSQNSVNSPLSLPNFDVFSLARSLLSWYARHQRDLPWRRTRDPYPIWVSEIMLQQTQVKTVIPYYTRWLTQFPSLAVLAAADLQKVLKVWQGLGYYSRARNLHKASQKIVEEFGGVFPQSLEDVIKLPGVGRTTAGGILSAAFNQRVPILDGNVKRVLARLMALEIPPEKALNTLWLLSETLLDDKNPRDFNQALMDLGATVCTPKNPMCLLCPWRDYCYGYLFGLQGELPMGVESNPIPHKMIGVAVIWNEEGLVLIDKRKADGLLGGLWEFPGGKVEPGETVEACIQREIQEELGIEIEVRDRVITIDHAYSHFKVTLNVFNCGLIRGEPSAIECDEVRWVTLEEIEQFPFPKANEKIIDAIKICHKVKARGNSS
jgi:A/G-specific adenine glycosylase